MRVFLLLLALAFLTSMQGQTKTDTLKITETALNYIEGWYTGDTARMDQALHPDLVKSCPVYIEQTKGVVISTLSKSYMIESTKLSGGKKTPKEKIHNEIKVLDIHENIASVKVSSFDYTDYLQMIRVRGEWKILQVLWVPNPKKTS